MTVAADFERSELSQAAFCERRGLEVGTFRHWLYRLRHELRDAATAEHFVPLVATAGTRAPFRLRCGNVEMEFAEPPPAGYLAELLRLMDR